MDIPAHISSTKFPHNHSTKIEKASRKNSKRKRSPSPASPSDPDSDSPPHHRRLCRFEHNSPAVDGADVSQSPITVEDTGSHQVNNSDVEIDWKEGKLSNFWADIQTSLAPSTSTPVDQSNASVQAAGSATPRELTPVVDERDNMDFNSSFSYLNLEAITTQAQVVWAADRKYTLD